MPDYEVLYYRLYNHITRAVAYLQEAQRDVEESRVAEIRAEEPGEWESGGEEPVAISGTLLGRAADSLIFLPSGRICGSIEERGPLERAAPPAGGGKGERHAGD